MKQMTLKIFVLENNPKFGSISTCWLLFFPVIFKWLKTENITWEATRQGSDFFYSVFESAPQTIVIVVCLLSFLNLSYCIGYATYKNLSDNIKYFKTFLERLKSVQENSMPE